jgi:MarR family 2-MHQ and catechol resistance regulon transcriptional repressor
MIAMFMPSSFGCALKYPNRRYTENLPRQLLSGKIPDMGPVTAADDALITTFGRLVEAHAAVARRAGRSLEQRCGIPHAWFEVLLRISRADGGHVSMGALAQQVALTTGGITRLLDRMIDAGLVQRVPCPTDRRVQFAALTDRGRAKLDEAAVVHAADLRAAFADFTQRDLDVLDGLLDKLRPAQAGPR